MQVDSEPTIAIHGAGQLAHGTAAVLSRRTGFRLLGPAARDDAVLRSGADVVIVATATLLSDVAADVRSAVEAGSNVLVSAEEAADPWAADARLATELDALARERGVTIAGAGLNPGLLFDALVLTVVGAHERADTIAIERVVDVSRFGPVVRSRLGLGYSEHEFRSRYERGDLLGHAGFRQSMSVVATALQVRVDHWRTEIEPMLGGGVSAGFVQRYTAVVGGKEWFTASFTGHDDPVAAGLTTGDRIEVTDGERRTTLTLNPGTPSQAGSAAMVANAIPRILGAPPGWLTVADLPPAVPWRYLDRKDHHDARTR